MREIKFRILKNEDDYKAWEDITIDDFIDNELFLSSKVYNKETLSQFTGLLDNNGKDIYEGDIVYNGADKYNYQIIWNEREARFTLGEDSGPLSTYVLGTFWEVIGNLHENPELLNK